MRGPRGDQESIPWVQYYGGTSLYPHLDLACDNVADLFSRMDVPSGLDSRRNQRLHLHHLALSCEKVADPFLGSEVPSGLASRQNQRLHLDHLAAWNR